MNDTCFTPSIEKRPMFGYEGLEIRAGRYRAEILVGRGFQVLRLFDERLGIDIVRAPASAAEYEATPLVFGIPVIVPPNRIDAGRFSAGGRSYALPVNEPERNTHIHGMLHRMAWEISGLEVDAGRVTVAGRYVNGPGAGFFEVFPHEFELRLAYELSPGGLGQKMLVRNTGSTPMPYALGYHTTFAYPFTRDCGWKCMVSIGQEVELDGRKLPTGRILEGTTLTAMRYGGLFPNDRAISAHATVDAVEYENEPFTGAVFEDESGDRRIIYEVGSGFRYWMLYNGGGNSGFLCVEPQTWVANAPNMEHFGVDTGFMMLDPGSMREDTTRIHAR